MTQWGYGWKKLYDSNWYEISILLDLSSFNKFRKKMLEKENAGPEFGLPIQTQWNSKIHFEPNLNLLVQN